ncbi:hypothetical protein K0M31_018923 [Melipona bicolor]|uniref:Uncharacterized protein n=1 Tax=Melipona bicolor TaxID=60889 RepID=A0AA40G506_9HYME|nr:hypothetical protein K0M31_018923 [Melipona bicolor]
MQTTTRYREHGGTSGHTKTNLDGGATMTATAAPSLKSAWLELNTFQAQKNGLARLVTNLD